MAEQKSNSPVYYTGIIVSIIGVALSLLLLCKHTSSELCSSSLGCSIDGVDGCKELGQSSYSKIGPIPIAFFGVVYYIFMTIAFYFQMRNSKHQSALILVIAAAVGLVVDAVLAPINFNMVLVPCILCAYTYLITLALVVLAVTVYLQSRRKAKDEPAIAVSVGSDVMKWGIASIVIAGVFAGVLSLSSPGKKVAVANDLLPEEKVAGMISDFNALKSIDLNLQGIKSKEGGEKGYIVVQKFADFLCPHCLHASLLLQDALKRWPGRIVVYYRHFPLDSTCNPLLTGAPQKPYGNWRCNGAQAAICASDYRGFANFYHGVFGLQASQLPITLEQLEHISKNAEIPWPQLRDCMGSAATQTKLMRDINDAKLVDIHSTPTLIINGHILPPGMPDREWFLHLTDALVYEQEGQAAYDEFRARRK